MTFTLFCEDRKPGPVVRTTEMITYSASFPDRGYQPLIVEQRKDVLTLETIDVENTLPWETLSFQLFLKSGSLCIIGCNDAEVLVMIIVTYKVDNCLDFVLILRIKYTNICSVSKQLQGTITTHPPAGATLFLLAFCCINESHAIHVTDSVL